MILWVCRECLWGLGKQNFVAKNLSGNHLIYPVEMWSQHRAVLQTLKVFYTLDSDRNDSALYTAVPVIQSNMSQI